MYEERTKRKVEVCICYSYLWWLMEAEQEDQNRHEAH